jgi:predicted anti-sigma-YlaC factor YlaD
MNCQQARRLFGACWDDETTRAERDWLESHFAACPACRAEYESYSRVLELAAALPRHEASPELVDRVLARARRLSPAPDRVDASGRRWVPITAAAAVLAIAGLLVAPWVSVRPPSGLRPSAALETIPSPELREAPAATAERTSSSTPAPALRSTSVPTALAGIPDSLFDHSEDVEFILDPVTLRHGRASVARTPRATPPVQGEQATITF